MGLFWCLIMVWAGPALFLELAHLFGLAGTHVRLPQINEAAGYIVVQLESIALYDRLIDIHAQPLEILRDHLVCVRVDPVRIRVFQPVDIFPFLPPDIFIIEYRDPGVAEMQGTGWPGSHAHDHFPLLCEGQVG